MQGTAAAEDGADFLTFVQPYYEAARRGLAARFGSDMAEELAAEVLAWAWEHEAAVRGAENPAGYLYRVGQSRARRYLRWRRSLSVAPSPRPPEAAVDPALHDALGRLRPKQRLAVLLVHAFGYSYAEAAAQSGMSEAALRNHLHRGMRRLRALMSEEERP